jgi:hypothetical protein
MVLREEFRGKVFTVPVAVFLLAALFFFGAQTAAMLIEGIEPFLGALLPLVSGLALFGAFGLMLNLTFGRGLGLESTLLTGGSWPTATSSQLLLSTMRCILVRL